MTGFKTITTMGVALAVALYQHYVAPIPAVDPELWAIAVPAMGLVLRFLTKTPVFNKES